MDMMELDGLAAIDSLFGIAGLQDDLMDAAKLIGFGAAGVGVAAFLMPKIPLVKDLAGWQKTAAHIAIAAGGGILAGRYVSRAAGAAFASAVGGFALFSLVKPMLPASMQMAGITDLGDGLYLGAGDLGGNSATDYSPLPGQVRGLGQAGNVGTRDLTPIPGQGSSGFAGIVSSFA